MPGKTALALDVRNLLCAQALMAVMKGVKAIESGGTLEVTFNSDDVKRDLVTWATELGHHVVSVDEQDLKHGGRLVVRKGQAGR